MTKRLKPQQRQQEQVILKNKNKNENDWNVSVRLTLGEAGVGNGVRASRPSTTVLTLGAKSPSEAVGVYLAGAHAQGFWQVRTCHLPTKSLLPRRGSAGAHVPPTHRAPSFSEVRFGGYTRAAYPLGAVLSEVIGRRVSKIQGNNFVCYRL